MCEVIIMSHRSKKELFVPVMDKKTNFHTEIHYFSEHFSDGKKAEVLNFSVAQAKAS